MKFTLYGRNGLREEIEGYDICDALFRAGRPTHALAQVAFYVKGEDHDFIFDNPSQQWVRKETVVSG